MVSSSDQLLAGRDIAQLMKAAESKGNIVGELNIFELHPTLTAPRMRFGLVWYLRDCVGDFPLFTMHILSEILSDSNDLTAISH